jgi:hypothetical protein
MPFLSSDALGLDDVIVVQTKKGNLNLARKASHNLEDATTQIRTALATKVVLLASKQKRLPSKAILCASGTINYAARQHVLDSIDDPHIVFLDRDELIPLIDTSVPEVWLNIDSDVLPYMRGLRHFIESSSDSVAISELSPLVGAAATDQLFVPIHLWKANVGIQRRKGRVTQVPRFDNITVTDLLRKPERLILILGDAGAGKSTCIRRLAYVLAGSRFTAEDERRIPILIRATDVAKNRTLDLVDICDVETRRISGSNKPAFTSSDLTAGHLVVLVDSLDELSSDGDRAYVLKQVLDFNGRFSECQVVMTSREYGSLAKLTDYDRLDRYRVSKINFKQAQDLVDRLGKKGGLPKDVSKELMRRLQEIHGMELNPLLVAVFAATSEFSRRDIPANITELFKKFTEMMLGRWDATKGFAQQYQAPLKDFVLTRVAYDMHWRRTTEISVNAFRLLVERELAARGHETNSDELCDEILNRSGLLRVVGDSIEFRHMMLQEFFAGRGIPSDDLLEKLVFDEWWRRAIVFYFGDRPGSSSSMERVQAAIASTPKQDRFAAAVTLGLAAQASYLIPVKEKLDAFVQVMQDLAGVKEFYYDREASISRFPLVHFLTYYIYGRDSVAASLLGQHHGEIMRRWADEEVGAEELDARTFWLIVGLIEAGELHQAAALVKKFHPRDTRLLLGIHLGGVLLQHLRVATKEQRREAERICASVEKKTADLLSQVQKEYKTRLLEVRRGVVEGIPETAGAGGIDRRE